MSLIEFVAAMIAAITPIVVASQLWVHRTFDARFKYLEEQHAETQKQLRDCLQGIKSEKN
jgi:hypothetical protein